MDKTKPDPLRGFHQELEARVRSCTAELHAALRYNRTLIETSLDPLVTIGPDGKITDVNAATEQVVGLDRNHLIGTDFCGHFTEPDKAKSGYQRAFSEGQVRDYPLVIRHQDGHTTPVNYNATVYRDESGAVIGVFADARDITELKRSEAVIRAERQRLYDVLEKLPVYVVLLDKNHHVPFANKFFRERFGDSGGKRCYEYLFNRAEVCEDCESYVPMKTHAPHHWEWHGPDGRDYDIYDYPFTDTDGSRMVMEMGIDITEMKKAQAALQTINETLERRVAERTAELVATNADLERFNRAMVDRELRMIELKKQVNDLCGRLGEPPRYALESEHEG